MKKIKEKTREKKYRQDIIAAIDRILAVAGNDKIVRSFWLGFKNYITEHNDEDNKEE